MEDFGVDLLVLMLKVGDGLAKQLLLLLKRRVDALVHADFRAETLLGRSVEKEREHHITHHCKAYSTKQIR